MQNLINARIYLAWLYEMRGNGWIAVNDSQGFMKLVIVSRGSSSGFEVGSPKNFGIGDRGDGCGRALWDSKYLWRTLHLFLANKPLVQRYVM
jgi:hypothetical protein